MSRYIDVDEITKDFKTFQNSFVVFAGATGGRKIVFTGKPADVRPNIHGHWLEHDAYDECSACLAKKDNLIRGDFNFCPNCGADMREPKDIIHKAIDNTTFSEEAYPNIKEELHKAVDMAEPKGEKDKT